MKIIYKLSLLTVVLALALTATGCATLTGNTSTALSASGVIETTEIAISPEIGGRVLEVNAKEGDSVQAGDLLLKLDDSLYQSQRQAAAATLDSARAAEQTAQATLDAATVQYDMALASARAADKVNRTSDWRNADPGLFDQPSWYFNQSEQIATAEAQVKLDKAAVEEAQANLDQVVKDLDKADFLEAEQRMSAARLAYLSARDAKNKADSSNDDDLIKAAQDILKDARDELKRSQDDFDNLLSTQAAKDVRKARAKVTVAQERYEATLDRLDALRTGEYSLTVTAAQKAVQQAQNTLEQARSSIKEAQAQVTLIDDQISKLSIQAPVSGVVLTRSIEPGEVIQPGMNALTIGKMDELTVTVYIPEDRYGQIKLGDHAALAVDSFPNQSFDATVTRIADQAEFTPRNVQTKEERQTTVYAVKLSVPDPQGKLKPGMPVDVTFAQ